MPKPTATPSDLSPIDPDNTPFDRQNNTSKNGGQKMNENPYIEVAVLSVQENMFTDKQTGEKRKMWRVYAADATGAVGSVWSSTQYLPGEVVRLGLSVDREGKFTAKLLKA